MFSTSAIIFIKCRNWYHMKNNARYKGNTNNNSAIIFLRSQKLPAMVLCLGEPPVRYLWYCCSSFCCCILIFDLHFADVLHFVVVLLIAFRRHPSPFRGLSPGFLHPILYFQSSPSQSDSRHFHLFNHSVLAAGTTALSGHFLPTGVFYLTLLPKIFGTTCFYQGLPGSQQFFLEVCRVSYWSLKHRPGPSVCLIHSNPQSSYSERFIFKFYQILAWIACGESLIYLLLTRFDLFLLVQSHM